MPGNILVTVLGWLCEVYMLFALYPRKFTSQTMERCRLTRTDNFSQIFSYTTSVGYIQCLLQIPGSKGSLTVSFECKSMLQGRQFYSALPTAAIRIEGNCS